MGGGGQGGGAAGCVDVASCEYPSQGLSFEVREGFSIVEPVTGRTLPLLVRVPEGPGPMPIVVWSHGGSFNDQGHHLAQDWGEALAAHGYAVLHVGHALVDATSGQALCDYVGIPQAECMLDLTDEDASGVLALGKSLDIAATLDALPMLSDASVGMGGPAVDMDRVVVAGWSAGSRAPLVMMGATFEPLPGYPPAGIPRAQPVAAMAFSPAGDGFGGFYVGSGAGDDSWSQMRGPVFVATGDNDVKPTKPELNGPVRRQAFEYQPNDGTRWMLYSNLPVGVGGHPTFDLQDLDASDERLVNLSLALRSAVLAFLDANVLGSAEAQAWLASDAALTMAGEAEWVHH